jgi:DNA-binding NarL/FixJ family response regulator
MGTMPTTVVLVEDHLAYRESFRLAVSADGAFQVVGEVSRAHDAPDLLERLRPDLVVIDFLLPDGNGISLARELKRRRLRINTLILGRLGHPILVRDALRAGVRGFVHKQEPLEVVVQAMTEVSNGQRYMSPFWKRQLDESNGQLEEEVPLNRLSPREREIFFLLIEGQSSKEIGKSLFLSAKTVDAHRLHINRKLGVRSSAGLTRFVADQGLLG